MRVSMIKGRIFFQEGWVAPQQTYQLEFTCFLCLASPPELPELLTLPEPNQWENPASIELEIVRIGTLHHLDWVTHCLSVTF